MNLRRTLRYSFLFALTIIISTLGYILADGLTNTKTPCELGVVLGSKVHPSGRPSITLQKRLEQATLIYKQKLVPKLMVSGGLGKEGHDEAIVMRNLLIKAGIPRRDIIVDSQGNDTRLTAKHAHQQAPQSVIVISNYYHISRAKLACQQAGIPVVHGSAAKHFHISHLWSVPREVVGWWAYLFRLK